ncbi:MAG: MerR family transcriptional regulator [Bacteroidales bacterium]|nr:MerR family transcriptional regulator [Bacteroidales bacterium]
MDKTFYKISQVEELLGIPQTTLRFWETQFTILKPRRTEKGTRYYTPEDLDKIRMIQYLVKERGLKIEKAQEIIKHNHTGVTKRYQAMQRLQEVRKRLTELLAAIDRRN